MQELMKQGLSVAEIQDTLRAALDDMVPQTYAPDADDADDESDELLESPVGVAVYYIPMEEAVIDAFADGGLDKKGLMERIYASTDFVPLELGEGISFVLIDFGKDEVMEDVTDGGEIVAGPDGEAFMPEHLRVTEADGYQYTVCEPMAFKTAKEVQAIFTLIEPITEKVFVKKANIKKLIKSGWLEGYDKKSVIKEANYIIGGLWEEFVQLREIYRKATEEMKGILNFVGYVATNTEDE